MNRGHQFRRIGHRRGSHTSVVDARGESLLTLLGQQVVERFARLGKADLVAVPLSLAGPADGEDPPSNPGHPACLEHTGTDYCRESWLLHLAQLRTGPDTHWHRCDYDRLCALVPVVHQNRCLAVVKLACTLATPEEEFERELELLDMLVRDFVTSQADFLERLPYAEQPVVDLTAPRASTTEAPTPQPTDPPQIARALQYIEEHLTDPALTVGSVARVMGVHPNYLSHLFVEQVGQRMTRYIATRRIEHAKTLLATTPWQVKRIARETGHANPNWFGYVFRALTGLSPRAYRARARGHSPGGRTR